jgi:dTDP-4-dehydrorhamnose reductase
MRILLTGANGQLGHELQKLLAEEVLLFDEQRPFELTDLNLGRKIIEQRPDTIIHAAAYTDVDGCERDSDAAFQVNAQGTRVVAEAAAKIGASLVYISTDYVFDGRKSEPYCESDPVNPLNAYGRSKLQGEEAVFSVCPEALVVRTSWLYGAHRKNFVKTILQLAAKQPEIRVVSDQQGSPTYARELAAVIAALLRQRVRGIIHAGGEGGCTWHEFASAILEEAQIRCRSVPITTAESCRLAVRPKYSVLSTDRLQTYGLRLSPWRSALKRFIEEYGIVQELARYARDAPREV